MFNTNAGQVSTVHHYINLWYGWHNDDECVFHSDWVVLVMSTG